MNSSQLIIDKIESKVNLKKDFFIIFYNIQAFVKLPLLLSNFRINQTTQNDVKLLLNSPVVL